MHYQHCNFKNKWRTGKFKFSQKYLLENLVLVAENGLLDNRCPKLKKYIKMWLRRDQYLQLCFNSALYNIISVFPMNISQNIIKLFFTNPKISIVLVAKYVYIACTLSLSKLKSENFRQWKTPFLFYTWICCVCIKNFPLSIIR